MAFKHENNLTSGVYIITCVLNPFTPSSTNSRVKAALPVTASETMIATLPMTVILAVTMTATVVAALPATIAPTPA